MHGNDQFIVHTSAVHCKGMSCASLGEIVHFSGADHCLYLHLCDTLHHSDLIISKYRIHVISLQKFVLSNYL